MQSNLATPHIATGFYAQKPFRGRRGAMGQVKRPVHCLGFETLVRVVTFIVSHGLNPPPVTRRGCVDGDLDVCARHVGVSVRRCVGYCLDGGWSGDVAWN